MAYTTVEEVSAELGGVTIDSSSTPSIDVVESWIADAEAEIEGVTGNNYGIKVVSTSNYEYHDYDGSGYIYLRNKPVINIIELSYEENGLGADSESWVEMIEGRTKNEDYISYKETGKIEFHNNTNNHYPRAGTRNVRVAYTYGYTTVPAIIRRLATLLVAKRYILSVSNNTATDEGGSVSVGTISVTEPSSFSVNKVKELNEEIKSLYEKAVGTFQTFYFDDEAF